MGGAVRRVYTYIIPIFSLIKPNLRSGIFEDCQTEEIQVTKICHSVFAVLPFTTGQT